MCNEIQQINTNNNTCNIEYSKLRAVIENLKQINEQLKNSKLTNNNNFTNFRQTKNKYDNYNQNNFINPHLHQQTFQKNNNTATK